MCLNKSFLSFKQHSVNREDALRAFRTEERCGSTTQGKDLLSESSRRKAIGETRYLEPRGIGSGGHWRHDR